MPDILLTAGCSFSTVWTGQTKTWPYWLAEEKKRLLVSEGWGSSGNGLISRRVIYRLNKLLQFNKPENIQVVIMWSGLDRKEWLIDQSNSKFEYYRKKRHENKWSYNPIKFVDQNIDDSDSYWLMSGNHLHGQYDINVTWYADYHNNTYAQVESLEHILRTQWFLEKHQIKYHMLSFKNILGDIVNDMNDETRHLWNMLDIDRWIFTDDLWGGLYEYVKNNNLSFESFDDFHPNEESHKYFVENFLKDQL